MKLIIDVDEKLVCEGFIRTLTEEERDILIRAIGNGVKYVEPKKGKWIKQENKKTEFFCSECGRVIDTKPFTRTDNFPFCHCGAKMRGDE